MYIKIILYDIFVLCTEVLCVVRWRGFAYTESEIVCMWKRSKKMISCCMWEAPTKVSSYTTRTLALPLGYFLSIELCVPSGSQRSPELYAQKVFGTSSKSSHDNTVMSHQKHTSNHLENTHESHIHQYHSRFDSHTFFSFNFIIFFSEQKAYHLLL